MKNIVIKRITLENFKKFRSPVTFEFGQVTNIFGRNGEGKTTIADGIMWVLFNRDYSGAKDFEIRPKEDGDLVHFVDINVTLVLDVDGKEITIQKTQKEKWVRKRGATEETFEGNENKYMINEVPRSEREFRSYFDEIITEEVFKYASNPGAFLSMKPKEMREKLFTLVSDFTDHDVIASNQILAPMAELLEKWTIEELMARNKKAIQEYNKKLIEIPTRIDELSKQIIEVDESALELQKHALNEQIESLEREEADLSKQADTYNKLQTEIMQAKFDLGDIERQANKENNDRKMNLRNKIADIEHKIISCKTELNSLSDTILSKKSTISNLSTERAKLVDKFNEIAESKMDENSLICPSCGQALPSDKAESIINDFEQNKMKQLDSIKARGQELLNQEKKLNSQKDELIDELYKSNAILAELKVNSENLHHELESLPQSVDLSTNQAYIDEQAKLNHLQEQLANFDTGESYKAQLKTKRLGLQSELQEVERKLLNAARNVDIETRIKELETELKNVAQLIANEEKQRDLFESFQKSKVEMLSESINKHFKYIKWKFFEPQINGGYADVCEPTIRGISYYRSLNKGHRVVAELDIVQAMQEIYKVNVPVIVDDAERINSFNIPKLDCQVIAMRVTGDDGLKVEVDE